MNRKILQKPGPQDWGTFLKAKYLPDPWPNFNSGLTFVAGIPKKKRLLENQQAFYKTVFYSLL